MWVMKEYGAEESWTQYLVLHGAYMNYTSPFKLVEVLDNREVVVLRPGK